MTIYSNCFSYTSFSLQKYITKHLIPKLLKGSGQFSRYTLSKGPPNLDLENFEKFAYFSFSLFIFILNK